MLFFPARVGSPYKVPSSPLDLKLVSWKLSYCSWQEIKPEFKEQKHYEPDIFQQAASAILKCVPSSA